MLLARAAIGKIPSNLRPFGAQSFFPRIARTHSNITKPSLAPKFAGKAGAKAKAKPAPGTPEAPATAKPAYPEKLCVYHAGTSRVTFLGVLKMATIMLAGVLCFWRAPVYYQNEGLGFNTIRIFFSGLVPMVFIGVITSPFVAFIHIRLPPLARRSPDHLRQFLKALPPQTELNITTINPVGRLRANSVVLSELRTAEGRRMGLVNLSRDTTAANVGRKWYQFRALGSFNTEDNHSAVPWAWTEISKVIAQRSR